MLNYQRVNATYQAASHREGFLLANRPDHKPTGWAPKRYVCWFIIPVTIVISSGWWYTYPPEKYEFVSWGDDIPEKEKVATQRRHTLASPTMFFSSLKRLLLRLDITGLASSQRAAFQDDPFWKTLCF